MLKECDKCVHYKESHLDDPCFRCLSGYSLPCFKKFIKPKNTKKKKEPIKFLPADTPLPWH